MERKKRYYRSITRRLQIAFDNNPSSLITATDIYTTHLIERGHWSLILKANMPDSLDYYLGLRDRIILFVIVISIISMAAARFTSLFLSLNFERSDKEYTALSLQFVQVEKMATVGRLAAGIAHENNNSLQMITNQAGWRGGYDIIEKLGGSITEENRKSGVPTLPLFFRISASVHRNDGNDEILLNIYNI